MDMAMAMAIAMAMAMAMTISMAMAMAMAMAMTCPSNVMNTYSPVPYVMTTSYPRKDLQRPVDTHTAETAGKHISSPERRTGSRIFPRSHVPSTDATRD